MPSVFSHAVAGFALARMAVPPGYRWKLPLAAAASAMVPDLDAIGFMMGVPYESFFGHRGFTHSIVFAGLWGALISVLLFRKAPWLSGLLLFLATASHPLLDMLTDGGLGCALFAPFSNERLFFPWRPIEVAPLSAGGFFTERGMVVFLSEVEWVWGPAIAGLLLAWALRRKRAQ